MKTGIDIIEPLRIALQQPLPGEEVRHVMTPSYRPQLTKEQIQANHPKVGGVLVLLYEKGAELHLVLTQRKAYDGVHGGQMSFPGGKKEKGDKTVIETALRENEEEIGVPATQVEVIGSLSELYIPPSNFLVYPAVGFTPKIEKFVPQKSEVETVVEIPVAFFLDEKNINLQTEIKLYNGTVVRVPSYVFGPHIIWGATALMLSEFVFILKRL